MVEGHAGSLTDMALILAAAFLGGTLIQHLKQPVLVGYIIVGIILGPSVLGIVSDRHQVDFLAELGILMLLFIIGIELNLQRFAKMYKISLITAGFQIFCGLSVMCLLGWIFGWNLERMVVLGFAVSLSSTAVAIKILQDQGQLNTDLGRTSVGILIAQDIAVIPMMLIVGAMDGSGFQFIDIFKIIGAVGLLALVIYILLRQPKWFTHWISAIPTGSQMTIVALTLCFSAASVAGSIGLSPGYGAFLAGLVIGNTTNSEKYESTLQPIFDVLMMIFFLSVGLMIDLNFIRESFWTVLLFLFFAMVIKTFLNIAVLRWQGVARHQAFVMGAALGQLGEFSFILAALGLAKGTIGDEGYKFMVSIIALSLIFTPVWTYAIRRLPLLRRYNLMKRIALKKKNAFI